MEVHTVILAAVVIAVIATCSAYTWIKGAIELHKAPSKRSPLSR